MNNDELMKQIIAALSSPDSKKGKLQRACLKVLLQHRTDKALPTSTRFVYYELKQDGVDTGTHETRRADQDVIDAVMWLRKKKVIPWEWIIDETRDVDTVDTAASVREWMINMLPRARIDPWQGNPPFIINESRSLRGVLRITAWAYGVPITSTNGQAGGFLRTDIAPLLRPGQPVAYFGDLNLAGAHIEQNTRRVLEREVGPLDWHRIAVTAEQAEQADPPLPPKPGTDGRYKDGRPHVSYECEALGQATVVKMLTDWLDALLPEPLEDVLGREKQERAAIAELLAEDDDEDES